VNVTSEKPSASRLAYVCLAEAGNFRGEIMDVATKNKLFDEGCWRDVESALTWARARADRVVLCYGYYHRTMFTAGAVRAQWPDGVELPEWPPDDAERTAIEKEAREEYENPEFPPGALRRVKPTIVRNDPRRDG
jgi:hypothetical protein